ncbi:hypothetical protein AGR1A_pAt20568 [Agrobacterium fabacearum CFBP 5771]|nr:hypothetical protein AGR1A_pAt20568 [Agrobacterium fabacearum CFBP 5771]
MLMTGTMTQIMLDLADILSNSKPKDIAVAKARVRKMRRPSTPPWSLSTRATRVRGVPYP